MAVKIYVHQQALIHADSLEELVHTREVATEAISQGGGGVESLSDIDEHVETGGDRTYLQTIHYLVLKAGL